MSNLIEMIEAISTHKNLTSIEYSISFKLHFYNE